MMHLTTFERFSFWWVSLVLMTTYFRLTES